jgi:hypothetical protein
VICVHNAKQLRLVAINAERNAKQNRVPPGVGPVMFLAMLPSQKEILR